MIEATSDYSDFREAWMACCEHRNLMPSKANMNLWSILRMRQSILRKSEKESTPEWCQKQPQNFWSNVREKNTLTITRRRASSSEGQDYSGAFICRNNKCHAMAANRPKAQQLWTDPTNRTKFLQCDYEYINTKCEHLVHWWNYVKPPLGKIQPKEPRPQPFRQPLSKHSQHQQVNTHQSHQWLDLPFLMFQIEDVNGHQTSSNVLLPFTLFSVLTHQPPGCWSVIGSAVDRSRCRPRPSLWASSDATLPRSGSGQRRAGEGKQVVDLQVKMDLKQSKGLWKIKY